MQLIARCAGLKEKTLSSSDELNLDLAVYQAGNYGLALEQLQPLLMQYNLGVLSYQGSAGLEQSYIEAAYWFQLAAEQGLALAQVNLGVMYEAGLCDGRRE